MVSAIPALAAFLIVDLVIVVTILVMLYRNRPKS